LNELGKKLLEKREELGIGIEEVAEDLKLKQVQVEAIESGDISSFKDVFYLKYILKEYAKYLGLVENEIVDEFNEYFYTETSKIPIDEIERVSKQRQKEKNREKRVTSPYTIGDIKKSKIIPIIIGLIIFILVLSIILIYTSIKQSSSYYNDLSYLEMDVR